MRIKKAVLSNFRKYRGKTFDFGANLNTITGNNGEGKTTVLDAVYWALTGYLLKDGSATANAIPYNSDIENMSVELEILKDDGNTSTIVRALEIKRGEEGRVLSTSESGSIDFEDMKKTDLDKNILELLNINNSCFGLNPIRLCIDPHYLADLCNGKDWKKARELILGLIDPQPFYKALEELPENAKKCLEGLDLAKNDEQLLKEANDNIKALKSQIAKLTDAVQECITGVCPVCGRTVDPELGDYFKGALKGAKKDLAKANEQKAALELAQTNSLISISDETESRFGVRFDLYKENNNGTREQCIVPYLPDGKPLKYGSQSEQIGAGIRIIKRASEVLGLPILPLIIDEGGEITRATLGRWGLSDTQIIMARADDIQLAIKEETI